MNPSSLFIRRPIMTTLVMVALLIFGAISYFQLPVSDLPNVDFPTLSVNASLPGASPDTMASAVATPLERQFSTIAGVDSMTSASTLGSTHITLQFALGRNIDAAAQDVQTAIASTRLPPGMPNPPTFRKVNPADAPILYLSLNSPTLPLSRVDEYGETLIAQRLSTISGVAQVDVYGSQKYAVRVQLNPSALASRGLGIDQVASAIQAGNSHQPIGTLFGTNQAYTLQSNAQLNNAAGYRNLIVAYQNGAPVRLQQLGTVLDSVENDQIAGWYNGTRGVVLAIERQPGTNTLQVVDDILRVLPSLRAQIPASVNLETVYNRATSIKASVDDVQFTLVLTTTLVVLIIFLFLGNLSATVIPSLALPGSIVGTFAVMRMLGFNLDNLSLMGLTLCTGFVVDDAIVMLENIVRRMEHGEAPLEAALNGSREIGFTIVAMTLSLVAVFIPLLFMGGLLGRLFNEFAITITAAVLVSGFVSLTLTPMLGSRFLRPHDPRERGRFYHALERIFDRSLWAYEWALDHVLRHRFITLLVSGALFAVTAYLFVVVPKGFIPSEDIGQLMGRTQAVQGISLPDMIQHQQAVANIIRHDPNVSGVVSSVGAGGPNASSNHGIVFIRLKPRADRALSADQVVSELRPKLARIPGIQTFLMNPPAIRIGAGPGTSLYQLTLTSSDTAQLYPSTDELVNRMHGLSDVLDVNSDLQINNPQIGVHINRDQASALGVSASQIETALGDAYGQREITEMYTPTNEYDVILEVQPEYQLDPSALSNLYVQSSTGHLVPIGAVATLTKDVGPVQVTHMGQMPSTTISFSVKPGTSLGQATSEIQKLAAQVLPDSVSPSFQGSAQVFQSSLSNLGILLLLSILVIYIVLGILYESFIHPLTVLSGLPSAGLGALLTLRIFGKDLDVYGFVGLIMLVGIVKKNAIMLIDFAIEAQKQGKMAADAIREACVIRFRPIMMTTMCALMGTLPIAIGIGAGAESRQSLGLAVVGGLLVSQLLTLFITPVIYLYMDRFQRRSKPRVTESHAAPSQS